MIRWLAGQFQSPTAAVSLVSKAMWKECGGWSIGIKRMLLPMVGNGNVGLHCNVSEGHSCIRWVWAILMSYDVNISTHTHMCICVHTLSLSHIYII